MLQIHCPYCDEKRDEIEFAHAGEAHYVRPNAKEQAEMSDEEWSRYMFIRDNIGISRAAICSSMLFVIR